MKKTTFLIAGRHAVVEALKNPNRKVHRVFSTEDTIKSINRSNQSSNLLKKIHIFYKKKKELDNLCGKDEIIHQGIVAEIEPLEQISLKEFLKGNNNTNINFIALDGVTDPRNIGSIIRTAACFNINGLIVKERSFPEKSKLLFKSASGGTEYLKVFKVANINTTLRFLKSKNFWVSAFESDANKDFTQNDWKGRNVLLFGSEGYGLKKSTEANSDFKFKIKINKNIESLNISNTVSIVCHYINQNIDKN